MPLIEIDETIEKEQNQAISKIIEEFGETYFRDLETELCKRLSGQTGQIVSCGGGAVLRDENAAYMKESGKIVLLTARPETIYKRVKDSKTRPILNGNMTVDYIRTLMDKRKDRYLSVADIVITTDGKTISQICSEIMGNFTV